eukprot:TRINITY_DN15612_c0_g2_i1.p1 TRINITY_DN15612_c0_g2~~TRINITY_DN15612_c0_g2_i1.p1  ORF type:complete len:482 (+),score=62.48 TRINITY_DN15612_c0_g2_i1:119-1564(+)
MVGDDGGVEEPPSINPVSKSSPWKVLILVSAFMFLDQFKPSEPHLVPYLIFDKHFTNEQVTNAIYPISVYAELVSNLIGAACVDYVGYKSVVVFGACARVCTRLLLIYGTSLFAMQLAEVTYGIGEASLTVLTASIFFLVESDQYQFVTSVTQAASLVGIVMSAELGQLLVDNGWPLLPLFYISLVTILMGSVVAGTLPTGSSRSESAANESKPLSLFNLEALWDVVQTTYSDAHLRALSVWWIMGTAVYVLLESYGMNLFEAVNPAVDYNGHVSSLTRLMSCLSSLLAIRIDASAKEINLSANGGMVMYVIGSLVVGGASIGMGFSKFLVPAYVAYIMAISISQLLLCLVFVHTARLLGNGRYVLLFALNAGASLVVQSVAQALIVYFNLTIFTEFMVIGWFSVILGVCFGCVALFFSFEQVHSDDASFNGRLANSEQTDPRSAYSSLLQASKGKAINFSDDLEANAIESSPLSTKPADN